MNTSKKLLATAVAASTMAFASVAPMANAEVSATVGFVSDYYFYSTFFCTFYETNNVVALLMQQHHWLVIIGKKVRLLQCPCTLD